MVLFSKSTLYDSDAHLEACCCFSTPSLCNLSTWRGYFVCFLHWESSVMVRYSLPLMKGDWLSFSSHLKCRQKAIHWWVTAVISLTIGTEMLASVFDNWLEICFFMVPSILVACLLAYGVLIGSLAGLYLAFCMWNVLACCRWLKLLLAGWYHKWLLSWL